MASAAEKLLAALNILNDPEKTKDAPIQPPALNVTRVGGLAAFIAAAGAAGLTLFNIKATDPTSLRIAAIAGTAAIVGASLFAAAMIISADLRARSVTAPLASEKAEDSDSEAKSVEKYLVAFREALSDAERGHAPSGDADGLFDPARLGRAYRAMALTLEGLDPPDGFHDEHNNLRLAAASIAEEADHVASLPGGAKRRRALLGLLERVLAFRAEASRELRELG